MTGLAVYMEEYRYKVSDFEGPLDLLLYLIEKNKVDIYNIPIVTITDQFNEYVRQIDTFDVNYASKFFVMAATLLQIKSRLLLPKPPRLEEEEEDPQELLIRQLVEYKRMKQIASVVAELWDKRQLMESRERTPMPFEKQFSGSIDKKALYAAFQAVYEALPEKKTVEIHLQQEIYSVSECMQRVEYALHQALRPVPVRQIFQSCRTRTELVVVFLAVLELLKIGRCCTLSEGEDGNAASLRYIPHGTS